MSFLSRRCLAVASASLLALGFTAAATGTTAAGSVPVQARATAPASRPAYLALGDSVPFGYISSDGHAYVKQVNFVGYPRYAGRWLHLHTVNAACPGEATGGFLSATDPDDNGCRTYRTTYPLHVAYTGTQLDYATGFLTAHPDTSLVTIQLGANDGFRLENQCNLNLGCIVNGLPSLTQTVGANLGTAVRALRATGYTGPIILVNYYSLNYNDPGQTLLSSVLDGVLTKVAGADRLPVADAFTAMKDAAAGTGGDTCAAGLLNVQPGNPAGCDVHPSQAGARVIASTVAKAYRTWRAEHHTPAR